MWNPVTAGLGGFGAGVAARKLMDSTNPTGEGESTDPAPSPDPTSRTENPAEGEPASTPPCEPNDEPCLTQWGWTGSPSYRAAVKEISQPGDHTEVQGKVPTYDEAVRLIEDAGGKIVRTEPGHDPAGESTHLYPHINYTTADGLKATVQIQALP
jgi:hypothetical protein